MSYPGKSGLRGDAERLLKALSDPHSSSGVVHGSLYQLSKMGLFPDTTVLYDTVGVNPNLRLDGGRIVYDAPKPAESSLAVAGRAAVAAQLERTRFDLDKRVIVRRPGSPKIETGIEVARLLDGSQKSDQRAARLVQYPRVVRAQLAVGDGALTLSALGALEAEQPQFFSVDPRTETEYTVRNFGTNGQAVTVIRSEQEIVRQARKTLLAADGEKPQMYGQCVGLTERQYVAVSPEWNEFLPPQLMDAAGSLSLQGPLEELETLLGMQDPAVATPVTSAVWLHQQVRPMAGYV